jgi:hypothetical protein
MPLDDEPFVLEFQDDQEIWVKHRISGHIVCFPISDDGEWIEDLHRINLDASSAYDGSQLIPSARRAARAYLKRSKAFSPSDRRASDVHNN